MEQKRDGSRNQSIVSNNAATPIEDIASFQLKHRRASWGLWERLVPDQIADDPPSRRISEIHFRRYETASRYVKGKRVLDIACGTGYGSQMLSLAGASSIVGVDVSPEVVQYAQQHYQKPGVEFICANAEHFEWSEPFDVVVSFETIEHLHRPDQFLKRLHRLLIPEGDLLLSTPLGETQHFDPYHLHAFTQADIFSLLERAGFAVELYRYDDWFVTRADLVRWRQLYPESQPPLGELFLTVRGWHIISDVLLRGGLHMPQLMVLARVREETSL